MPLSTRARNSAPLTSLGDRGAIGLIRDRCPASPSLAVVIGDDAAVVVPERGALEILTTDALVSDLKARPADDEAWDLARDAAHYAQHSREAAEALRDLAQHHEAIAERLGSAETGKPSAAGGCCGKGMADKGKAMADKAKGMADKPAGPAPTPAEPNHSAH